MLSFSKKFPASLQARASAMHAQAFQAENSMKAALIERLASDSRMDTVWVELTKCKRDYSSYQSSTEYFHPARAPKQATASLVTDPQPTAIEEFFRWIVSAVECAQLLAAANDVPVADLLLQEADRLRGADSRRNKSTVDQLSKAAAICASIQKPNLAPQVVIELATYLEERFGSAMYGMLSTVASVALDQNITKAMVRRFLAP